MNNKGIDMKAMFKRTQKMWDKLMDENKCVGNWCELKENNNYDQTKKSLKMDKKIDEFLEFIGILAKEQVIQLKKLNNGNENEKN